MITRDQLTSINFGDVIEAGVLIPGLCSEKLLWSCVGVEGGGTKLVVYFEVTYMGVWISTYRAFLNKKSGVSFKEEKS